SRLTPWIVIAMVLVMAGALWRYQAPVRDFFMGFLPRATPTSIEASAPPIPPAAPTAIPPPSAAPIQPPATVTPPQNLLEVPAQRAGAEARAVFERAKEAADGARTLAGEAKI